MAGKLLVKTLRDQLKPAFWWGLGVGLLGFFVVWMYPALNQSDLTALLASLPESLKAFLGDLAVTGVDGLLNTKFLPMAPLILAVFAIGEGSFALAGEEEKGTMDILLSYPVRRWQVVAEKAGATVLSLLFIIVHATAWLMVAFPLFGVEARVGTIALSMLNMVPLLFAVTALSLLLSALLRARGTAALIAAAVLVASYFLDSFGKIVDKLEPYRPLSLYYYYASKSPLSGGMAWGNVGLLLGLGAVMVALAALAFHRKDVAV